jgi:anti-sigma B factor antagonist
MCREKVHKIADAFGAFFVQTLSSQEVERTDEKRRKGLQPIMVGLMYNTEMTLAVLPVTGRFDADQVHDVQHEFDSLLTAGARFIILDLSDVQFVDSSALAVLVRGMRSCRERNGELLLCGLRQPVKAIFELTRMDRAIRIYRDELSARTALAEV